ncbi:hypothetical protein J6590_027168 [Homalodisca vitripennis]|nr:hypothetical protein J6590_027168 [Homalodisca vitripennis]
MARRVGTLQPSNAVLDRFLFGLDRDSMKKAVLSEYDHFRSILRMRDDLAEVHELCSEAPGGEAVALTISRAPENNPGIRVGTEGESTETALPRQSAEFNLIKRTHGHSTRQRYSANSVSGALFGNYN